MARSKISRDLQLELLNRMEEVYRDPLPEVPAITNASYEDICANLKYLEGRGLCESGLHATMGGGFVWGGPTITAPGLDYLQHERENLTAGLQSAPPMRRPRGRPMVETAFASYELGERLGEGANGVVFAATGPDREAVAIKVLRHGDSATEKRKRFKNELHFLLRHAHPHIVALVDYGIATNAPVVGPFYVMPRYTESLRARMNRGVAPKDVLPLFNQMIAGVEAAHLLKVVHRDLKPENFLYDAASNVVAVADFGIASFTDEMMATSVETKPGQRLANFLYAAPEQLPPGGVVGPQADIYALGLMLNELFTREIPRGASYTTISSAAPEYSFLDDVVALMISQSPGARPASLAIVKGEIERRSGIALAKQGVSEITKTVVTSGEIDDPLAHEPPKLASFDYDRTGRLTLTLDRDVTPGWVDTLRNHLGSYASVLGKPPERFQFSDNKAVIAAARHEVQPIIDHFKNWLPQATMIYKSRLVTAMANEKTQREAELKRECEAEEAHMKMLQSIRI